ncbi:MAG: hypothetical protein JST11_09195 [Acidobacteria bacterium]|nr:hypothetical protein [Acidobacteriota bacterium]
MKLAAAFTACVGLMWAQEAQLAEARLGILEAIRNLPRYTCTQTVDRSRFVDKNGPLRRASCDQILANRRNGIFKPRLTGTDRLRMDVLNSDQGVEVYSWPGAGRMSVERIQDLAGEGDIGTGSFGPFLINIFNSQGVVFVPEGTVEIDGARLFQYRYRVPEKSSHYRVEAAGSMRVVPFDGRFWIDAGSLELRRLTVRTGELTATTGHCEATTSVDFARTRIGTGEFLLPRQSLLETIRRDGAEARNTTRYASCREFTGESVLRFDGMEETPGQDAAAASASAFPAGVRITVALLDDIDTASAAAGDALRARVVKSAARPGKRGPALPAGTVIHGRLLRLEHHLVTDPGFSFALAFESVELGGRTVPFAAIPDRATVVTEYQSAVRMTGNTVHQWSSGRRAATRGGTFVFPTDRANIVIPRGTESQWITIAPPK